MILRATHAVYLHFYNMHDVHHQREFLFVLHMPNIHERIDPMVYFRHFHIRNERHSPNVYHKDHISSTLQSLSVLEVHSHSLLDSELDNLVFVAMSWY